ncbi:hypothetical protein OESDEN_03720 [Oesophagostomum dentatum]|uniref:Uncharacterized protein n=1 Tax=Oesophagostomum dentatum TaxID=61180 RepID=A0A0B1TFJ3_OESDE|nr:hypothetical protein OESDEN_03720 [Oesophagostomum dentatum]
MLAATLPFLHWNQTMKNSTTNITMHENIAEHVPVEMCENGCQTEDSGDIETPQLTTLTAAVTPENENVPSLITTSPPVQATTRERRHAGSGIPKDSSLFRDNVAKMAESTEEVLQKIMQTREQQPAAWEENNTRYLYMRLS